MTPIETFLEALREHGCNPRECGNGWEARCPHHDDENPSLSIGVGGDGKVLFDCKAGCGSKDVIAAVGLTWSDLFTGTSVTKDRPRKRTAKPAKPAAKPQTDAEPPATDWSAKQREYVAALTPQLRNDLAGRLGLPAEVFDLLPTGWDSEAWTFPERDAAGDVIGLARRFGNGRKLMHKDSKRGLTRPEAWRDRPGPVFIVEGQSDTLAMTAAGLCCVGRPSNVGGADLLAELLADWPADRPVVVCGENDRKDNGNWPGKAGAEKIARHLADALRRTVMTAYPPEGLKDVRAWLTGPDLAGIDWPERGESIRQALLASAEAVNPKPRRTRPNRGDRDGDDSDEGDKPSQSKQLVQIAEQLELWHSDDGEETPFATLEVNGHREHWRVESQRFRDWLSRACYELHHKVPTGSAVSDALNVVNGIARFGRPAYRTWLRVGSAGTVEQDDWRIYLDLADNAWRAAEVSRDGWRIVSDPPVRFVRQRGMLPLPEPVPGGNVDELRDLLNVGDDRQWILTVAFLIGALQPHWPTAGLLVTGEQGSAKTTFCKLVRSVIDPHDAETAQLPRTVQDAYVSASHRWALSFDNVSGMPKDISNALCSIVTGGAFPARTLFTNVDETVLKARRPLLVNGIDFSPAPDLLNRVMLLHLPVIPDNRRLTESKVNARFAEVHPRVLGALLDAVSMAMRRLPDVDPDKSPRMADFCRWATAAESALPWPEGGFMKAYLSARDDAEQDALGDDPVASAVIQFVTDNGPFRGTPGRLLGELSPTVSDDVRKDRSWPTNAKRLITHLKRIAPQLRRAGVDFVRTGERVEAGYLIMLMPRGASAADAAPDAADSADEVPF